MDRTRQRRGLAGSGIPVLRRGGALYEATAEERAAVIAFARQHPELRHRALAWTMVDRDVAALSPSTVYRILREAGLVARWERRARGRGQPLARPAGPGELWQTDLRYVKVRGRTSYLLVFLDVFSRFVVHHELLRWIDGQTVALAAHSALGFLTPAAVHAGRAEQIRAERRRKLSTTRQCRKEANLRLRQLTLPLDASHGQAEPHLTVNTQVSQFA